MLYIPTKIEKLRAYMWMENLKKQGVDPSNLDLDELLAMYGKHIKTGE